MKFCACMKSCDIQEFMQIPTWALQNYFIEKKIYGTAYNDIVKMIESVVNYFNNIHGLDGMVKLRAEREGLSDIKVSLEYCDLDKNGKEELFDLIEIGYRSLFINASDDQYALDSSFLGNLKMWDGVTMRLRGGSVLKYKSKVMRYFFGKEIEIPKE